MHFLTSSSSSSDDAQVEAEIEELISESDSFETLPSLNMDPSVDLTQWAPVMRPRSLDDDFEAPPVVQGAPVLPVAERVFGHFLGSSSTSSTSSDESTAATDQNTHFLSSDSKEDTSSRSVVLF